MTRQTTKPLIRRDTSYPPRQTVALAVSVPTEVKALRPYGLPQQAPD
jgi:hypothetical protein